MRCSEHAPQSQAMLPPPSPPATFPHSLRLLRVSLSLGSLGHKERIRVAKSKLMNAIRSVVAVCLVANASGEPAATRRPLTYEESQAANRPPTVEAGKAWQAWVATLASFSERQIADGATNAEVVRETTLLFASADETRFREQLAAAGWAQPQVNRAIDDAKELYLPLSALADSIAKSKRP